jgi:hypothetical protein
MKTCKKCKKKIHEIETHCSLISYSNKKITHEDSWHCACWRKEWADKMAKRDKLLLNSIGLQTANLIKSKFGDAGMMPSIRA